MALCLAAVLVTMSPQIARADSGVLFGNLPWPSYGSSYTSPTSNTVFLDINPMYNITESGVLTRWDWYAQSSLSSGTSNSMYLMVWRPTTDSSVYTLKYQQLVDNKTDGAQWVDAVGSFVVNPGDVLGFYLSADSQRGIAEAYNPGSSSSISWTTSGPLSVGTTHNIGDSAIAKSDKTYALAAELSPVPEPSTVVAALSVLAPVGLFFRRKRKTVL